ncbi:hypothetical protein BGW36DRAFT_348749 [Talaromyces proteolyticus]|uniref:Uncharacterized protein n=1 Tax=Talaromyces proteolyticus TaxID=1131652 RepID=A0AAD4KIJ7_9EURO|nr:uncharacterized protein BGW36DRAFT_348749 [Talaromyces proteolyticus]KAH8692415.1 hypothetical protein BGW36DRAFT_348749 [Talaromyces proteolyticus]
MNRGYYPAAHEVAICQPLSEIDTRSLTAKQVLFYFGVLTLIQPHLHPTFEYSQDYPGKWTAKLFLYRETLSIPRLRTQMAAKVEICRVALSLLKSRYADWRVPDEPNLALTTPEWLWVEMLEEYARSNKLPAPVFTKYIHKYGYRYETGVGTVACWGVRKFYDTEAQAADAAAHQTLYLLLTEGSSDLFSLSSASEEGITIKQSSEDATSIEEKDIVKRDNDVCNDVNVDTRQNFPHANQPTSRGSRAESFCPESMGKKRLHDFMSNLVPVSNARISTVSVGKEPEQKSKWGVTVNELLSETRSLNAWSEKVNKICEILHLTPKFTLDSSPIHLPTSCKAVKSYSIWVTFQDDPYLTRAGAIGKVYGFYASEDEAKEACCNRVHDYLLNLVKEDTAFEQEERESYELIRNFGQSKRRKLERMGYAVCR